MVSAARASLVVGLMGVVGACAERPADELALQLARSDQRLARILEGNHPHWDAERLTTSTSDLRVRLPVAATDALTVRRGTHLMSMRATSAEGVFAESLGRLILARAQGDIDFVIAPWCAHDRAECAVEGVEWALVVRRPRAVLRATWKLTLNELTARMTNREGDVLLVDSTGTPHFRIPRPYAVDSAGERRDGFVAVDGDSLIVQVDTRGLAFPIVVDPSIENAVWINALPTPPGGIAFDDTQRRRVLVLSPSDGSTWEWNPPQWTRLPASPPVGAPTNDPISFGYPLALAWDSSRSRAVAFGSVATRLTGNDTWEWTGGAWVAANPSVRPSPRTGAAMAYDAAHGETVLFGGWTPASNETWIWDGVNWALRTPLTSPAPRFDAHMAFDAVRSRIILHGGWVWNGTGYTLSGETWEWDGTTWRLGSTGPFFEGLLTFDPTEGAVLLVSAGQTRRWDGTTWSPVATLNQPAASFGFGVFDATRQRLVIGSPTTWEVSARQWEQVPRRPTVRFMHRSAWDPVNRSTLMFGGLGDPLGNGNLQTLNDTWLWNGSLWLPMQSASSPSPRTRFGLATDFQRRRIVLFGGQSNNGTLLSDTWEWDGVSWRQLLPPVQPSPRVASALGWDDQQKVIVLFGGGGANGLLNDTWVWNGITWSPRTPVHRPPERHGHGLAWSNSEQFLLLAGGNPVGDVWKWDGADWSSAVGSLPGSSFSGLASSDRGPLAYMGPTVEYFAGAWVNQTSNEPTPTRFYAGLSNDPVRHRVVLTAGQLNVPGSVLTDEVWEHVTRGRTCTAADECGTGFCVDGVCCDSACGNGDLFDCLACSRERGAALDGVCAVVGCKAAGACLTATCDPSTGACVSSPIPDGGSCDDSRECTLNDVCVAGSCVGSPAPNGRTCRNEWGCGVGTCSGGACVQDAVALAIVTGWFCDDRNPCSTGDVCSDAGTCMGAAVPDGTGCDDQQLCTDSDSCTAGVCGGAVHVCSPGTCATGTCSLQERRCFYSRAADGASCADSNACTDAETCSAGVCTTVPVSCLPAGECERGACSPTVGCEFTPAADGLTCDGGVCRSGVCQSAPLDAGAPDGGPEVDGGIEPDAGVEDGGSRDAGVAPDAGQNSDAGVLDGGEPTDGATPDAGAGEPQGGAGCSCATIDPAFLAGLLLIASRRTRRRS